VHAHNDEENKKNMTSMYTNTHLTAKKEENGKDGTHSVMIMRTIITTSKKQRRNGYSNTIGIRYRTKKN
jgi:hypothetical protein